MKITHKIHADLQKTGACTRISMVQCDDNSRVVEIILTCGGAVWVPEKLTNVILRYRKSDGSGGSYDTLPNGKRAWVAESNRITVEIANQMLTVPGLVEAQAVLHFKDGHVATFAFQIAVEADPSADVIESEDYVNWAEWSRQELEQALKEAKESGDFMGACYLPAIDAQGNLSWTNDAGMKNPAPVNITDLVAEKISAEILKNNMISDLNMNGHRICALAEPQDNHDAVTKNYVQKIAGSILSRNLLDNGDFRNPVNQRGQSEYSNANYTIDRWKWTYAVNTRKCNVNNGSISLSNTSATAGYFQQVFETALESGTYTAAVKIDGVVYTHTMKSFGNTDVLALPVGSFFLEANGAAASFLVPSGSVIRNIEWVVLYKGEYTAEALRQYQGKGYGAELAECQRYYQIRSQNSIPAVDLRPVMRVAAPVITSVSNGYAYSADI